MVVDVDPVTATEDLITIRLQQKMHVRVVVNVFSKNGTCGTTPLINARIVMKRARKNLREGVGGIRCKNLLV